MDFDPYVCEECLTDFTPSWKAISGVKGDYHLYCEQCVRQTQKRQIRQDHTLLLKKVFQKNTEQEKVGFNDKCKEIIKNFFNLCIFKIICKKFFYIII